MMKKNKRKMPTISLPQPTERFELDFDKIKTIEDCVLILKAMILCINGGRPCTVCFDNTGPLYEEAKHLAKDGSIREV